MFTMPASARLACWVNGWLAARESADDLISGVTDQATTVEFVVPGEQSPLQAALFLRELRRWQVRRASSALPVPGDPLGLGGPPEFNVDVMAAAEGVLLHGPGLGLVPVAQGSRTRWRVGEANPPTYLPSVADADRALREALTEAARHVAELDVASWRADVADALMSFREPTDDHEPTPFASRQAARVAAEALRAARIVELARADDGGAATAFEANQRAAVLQPLDHAARAALVAATSSLDGR